MGCSDILHDAATQEDVQALMDIVRRADMNALDDKKP